MASQITKMRPGNHQPMGVDWAGTDVEKEDDERDATPDGTDYKPVKKSYRLYKSLIQDETLLKAMEEEEMMEEEEEEDEDKDDKGGFKAMMAEAAEKGPVRKSFFDYVEQNATLRKGISSSPFLFEMVKSIGYSFLSFEDNVGTQMLQMDMHHDQFAKSVDGVFGDMSKSLGFINDTADQIDVNKSVGANGGDVQYLEKGGFGAQEAPSQHQVLGALMKGVEAGTVSPLEVVKFETTGSLAPHIQKSLGL